MSDTRRATGYLAPEGFVEELRAELGRRGIEPQLGGETHALPDHDEITQREQLESLLDSR